MTSYLFYFTRIRSMRQLVERGFVERYRPERTPSDPCPCYRYRLCREAMRHWLSEEDMATLVRPARVTQYLT